DLAPALPSLDDVQSLAGRANPILRSAFDTVRGANLDIRIARQALLPTLTVDGVYGIEANAFALRTPVPAPPDLRSLPSNGYFITASLNFPVWDWGVRRSKVRQAELKRDQAAVELSAAQRNLLKNMRDFYEEAQTARDQIELLRGSVDLASESLRLNTL